MAGIQRKGLLVQTSHYSMSSLFAMVAGLVTFPILTRVFSVADYGVMNLVAAALSISVALGKVGVQQSSLLFYGEIVAGKGRFTLRQLYSTTVFGMAATAAVVMVVLLVAVHVAPASWAIDARLRMLLSIAALLVLVRVTESALINFLRAEQSTWALMRYSVASKYLVLAVTLIAIFAIARSLTAYYTASVFAETLAVGCLAVLLFRGGDRPRPSLSQFSRPLHAKLIASGIPMMIGYELATVTLVVGGRYVINATIGATPLGLYSAAYNLCQYVQAVFIASVAQAIIPIYMQMWSQKGVEETSAFIGSSLRTYVVFGMPIVAGLAAIGPELLPALASEKYASAALILPWVIGGMVVDGTNAMVGAGLFIHRRTGIIMTITLACATLNIGLNLLLVPRIGILGAAIATLLSYAATSLALAIAGRRLLPVALPWATLIRAGLVALLMYAALSYVYPGHRLLTVGARLVLGALFYGVVMVLLDPDARELARKALQRLQRPATKAGT